MNKNRCIAGVIILTLLLTNLPSNASASAQTNLQTDISAFEQDGLQPDASTNDQEQNTEAKSAEDVSAAELEDKEEHDRQAVKSEIEDPSCRVIVELEGDSLLDMAAKKEISYAELPDEWIEKHKEELRLEQDRFLDSVKENTQSGILPDARHYDTVLNGVAMQLRESDIARLEGLEGVKQVYVAQEYERPLLQSSKDIIGTPFAYDTLGLKGDGTVVAVIDSGIHAQHSALRLDDANRVKLKREDVEERIRDLHLRGKYFSAKIPYGYNYYDNSYGLRDAYGVMHGMHVSGIVGANDESRNIRGVAPNAQILAMKVFSDDLRYPTTFTDVWLQAVDDAIELGADVINMSLGSAAGLNLEGRAYPEVELIKKARQAGISVVVAAGNDAEISHGNSYDVLPLEENYDTSVIASPALHEDTFAVASMENTVQKVHTIRWKDENGEYVQEAVHLYNAPDQAIKGRFTDLQKGEGNKFTQENIANRIVLLELTASGDMAKYAGIIQDIARHKPLALVLYNEKGMGERLGSSLDLQNEVIALPMIRARYSTYQKLSESAGKLPAQEMELEIPAMIRELPNPQAGKMSVFSSWGPTPDLRLKPEILAPGGNIYSTSEDDRYKNMSGTSMAAPQVSGAAAILKQYIRERKIPTENEADFIKLLLMNTAKPLEDPESVGGTTPYFVRRQGSGVMQLDKALQTKVVVRARGTNDEIPDGKLELKELSSKQFTVDLEFENFSDQDKSYYVSTLAMYEPVENKSRSKRSAPLSSEQDQFRESVEVPANSKKSFQFTVNYEDAAQLERNQYLEGYINIEDTQQIADLSVPFLGFYGDWDEQTAIDAFALPEWNTPSRNVQFYVNKELNVASSAFVTKRMLPLPIIDNAVYFSPEGMYHTELACRLGPLRNMDSIEYSVLDGESMEVLRVLGMSHSVRKLNRLGRNNTFRLMPDSVWDGKLDDRFAEEKEYIYQIKAKLNTIRGSEQVYRYPVRVDNTAPYFVGSAYLSEVDGDRLKKVHFKAADTGSGIQDVYIQSVKYDKGTDAGFVGTAKYGKYTKIRFVEEESRNNAILPKVVDGKVEIPVLAVPRDENTSGEVFVCINGHRNKEVEVICPYFADTSHIQIALKDYVSHRKAVELQSGIRENFNSLQFLNFYTSIRDNGVQIHVNGELLQQYAYNTTASRAEVRMHIPNANKHVSTLYIKRSRYRTDYIINNDHPNWDNMERYRFSYDKDSRTISFTIDPFDSSCEIITSFKDKEMPEWKKSGDIRVDLSEAGLENFKEYKQNREVLSFAPGESHFSMQSGRLKLQLIYKDGGHREVEKVLIRQGGEEKILRKGAYFDLDEGRASGYANTKYALYIYEDLREDAAVIIQYRNANGQKPSSVATPSEATSSNARREHSDTVGLENGGMDHDKDHDHDKDKDDMDIDLKEVDDSHYVYPVIFLTRPSLLEVLSKQNVHDNKLEIKGFVGKVKNADSIEGLELVLLDKKGRPSSEVVRIRPEELTKKGIRYKEKGRIFYTGFAHHFEKEVEIKDYHTAIQVNVRTKAGESASIVRRVLYDAQEPQLQYTLLERDLDSDAAKLLIHAKDNSFKVKIYRNDSLIQSVDHSARSLFTGGVTADREIRIPLKAGQNEIRISAVDPANQRTEKTVYIYRTHSAGR